MKKFTKKELNEFINNKKNQFINEAEKNSYVQPSSDNINSLANDLSKAKNNNPTDKNFIVNTNSYDGNTNNNPITIDINATNPNDGAMKLKRTMQNPSVKTLMSKNNVNANIRMNNESIEDLKNRSILFSKKELDNILR